MAPPHFLVVTFIGQGHLNPSRALAARIARATGARVTLSAAVSMHRLMFPSLAAPDEEVDDGGPVAYAPYSDGYDDGFRFLGGDQWDYVHRSARVGRETLAAVLDRLAARGRPVTCVVYTILLWWAGELARERGVPGVLFWVQPATVLAVYHHYFHGYQRLVAEHAGDPGFAVAMPGLPPMAIRDLPVLLTDSTGDSMLAAALYRIRKTMEQVDLERSSSSSNGGKAMVLVNTVEALEAGALTCIPGLDVLPIGPVFAGHGAGAGGTETAEPAAAYMEWLDTKPARSVVYVSFGSISAMGKRQREEMRRGLAASGRPYLCVVRENSHNDGGGDDDADELDAAAAEGQGVVVEWCDQARVLAHAAVGCFVTHCGWNSTLESVAAGVPVVAVPQCFEQRANARLAVAEWGVGVRAAVAADGVLEGEELSRCLEMVMGDNDSGVAVRRSSAAWKAKVMEATGGGGSSDRNFTIFLDRTAKDP
ncbi:hypothetical protein ACP70R_014457 [Stipagrostis hirtigluma subsp. patula]